jgi:chemotaxis response regulator CheB
MLALHSKPARAATSDHSDRPLSLGKGRIYIAPPGRHLIVDGDQFSLGVGPCENNARPAIDPMLRSTLSWTSER